MTVHLGAIADDFTGATDLANTLVQAGMRVVQTIYVPERDVEIGDAEGIVVALKSRTVPVDDAVAASLRAVEWLQSQGAHQFFFKYCSTFDSTSEGNIGPVGDALLDYLGTDFALVCPAFPTNGRTIYQGYLFVGDQLLAESSMKDHPLTPMHDSSLIRLMAAQSTYTVGSIDHATVRKGPEAIAAACDALRKEGTAYGVIDALVDDDLRSIDRAARDHTLITGGSGVALGLPENFRRAGLVGSVQEPTPPMVKGRAVILAGSCSTTTRKQIEHASKVMPHILLDVEAIAAGSSVIEQITIWIDNQDPTKPLLIYSSAEPSQIAAVQSRYGKERAGALLEDAFGQIAQVCLDRGSRRFVIAGGETSGAVVSALHIDALRIGPEIDPGVPWTETLAPPHLALALKSGNFGGEEFFTKALEMLP